MDRHLQSKKYRQYRKIPGDVYKRQAKVDADNVDQLIELINDYKPDLVMNIALPYQDLTIMDACLACGVNYMDTANYEPEDTDDPQSVSYTHLDVYKRQGQIGKEGMKETDKEILRIMLESV